MRSENGVGKVYESSQDLSSLRLRSVAGVSIAPLKSS